MSKMSELSHVLDDLISCGEKMIQTANAIKECVRALLAAKANEAGGQFKTQVKAIVKKYGNGGSLTDVPAESYPALVEEVEGLKDA